MNDPIMELIDAYAEARHKFGSLYNTQTAEARQRVVDYIESIGAGGMQQLSPQKAVPASADKAQAAIKTVALAQLMGRASRHSDMSVLVTFPSATLASEFERAILPSGSIPDDADIYERWANKPVQALSAASAPERSTSPLSDFQDGQWWVQELNKIWGASARTIAVTDDLKRAVAVVHHLLRAVRETEAAALTPTAQADSSAPEYVGNGMFKGETIQQAAEHWANWCDVRCMTGLSEFLRVVAASPPAEQQATPAWAGQAVIEYRYTGGTHWCPLGPAERMKPDFDGVYRLQAGVYPVEQAAPKAAPGEPSDAEIDAFLDSPGGIAWVIADKRERYRLLVRAVLAKWAAPQQEAQEPVAWESTTPGYIKYITQARYEKFSPAVRRWYKPYKCSSCTAPKQSDQAKELADALRSRDWYKQRCDQLQKAQSTMRDPERTMVCDIIANGMLLEPAGDRYAPQPAPAELEQMRERISRMGLDVDRAMRGQVNEQSPLGTTRLAAIAALAAKPATPLLSKEHHGMRVDYSGLLVQCQRALRSREPANAEMLRQLQWHLQELGHRWYAGDANVVDEFLQLYCIEHNARAALVAKGGAA